MLSHWSLFVHMGVHYWVYNNVCICQSVFCAVNELAVAGDAAVTLDYTERQASLLHLIDHIGANLAHSCQFSASMHLLLKAVCMCACVGACLFAN